MAKKVARISMQSSLWMLKVRDGLVSTEPFIVRRQVLWGECDPAGFVYTPRFGDYAVGAVAFFNSEMLGEELVMEDGTQIGLPVKDLSFEFERFLKPSDIFDMRVTVESIGERTFGLLVEASSAREPVHFRCRMTRICLDPRTSRSIPMPGALTRKLQSLSRVAS